MADELYRPGFSFENPKVTRIPAPQRTRPWFYQETAVGPLTIVSKKTPFERDKMLHPYMPVWLRRAKQRNTSRLGAYFRGVPSFTDLGDAAPATAPTTGLTRDSNSGFLNNAIVGASKILDTASQIATTVTGQLTAVEQQKQEIALAQQRALMAGSNRGSSSWLWALGIGTIGAIAFVALRR